jgi:chemotaxis protein MotA
VAHALCSDLSIFDFRLKRFFFRKKRVCIFFILSILHAYFLIINCYYILKDILGEPWMEITSLIGPILGIVAIVGTSIIKGLPPIALIGGSAMVIIGVGTLGAVVVGHPLKDIIYAFKSLGLFFMGPKLHVEETLLDIERLAQVARKDGVLALEKEVEKLDNEFLQKGIEMVAMNTEPTVIEDTLLNQIQLKYDEEEVGAKFWEDVGIFSPTVGIIGAVLGLMVVMLNLQNPEAIGPGIKTAFIATVYGVALANLFAIPCSKKLKRMLNQKKNFRETVAAGIVGISQGTSPKILIERLRSMVGKH